jgi:predicted transcriptional regulator
MDEYKLYDAEYKFLSIIWAKEPINSTLLTKECAQKLGWKKPTTYTMIRKLCERGILKNENTVVSSLVKRDQVQKYESEQILEKTFDNSLPSFVAAFLQDKKLTQEDAEQIRRMIEEASK